MSANLRKYVGDYGIHTIAARVELMPGSNTHYYVSKEKHLIVHCRTLQHDISVEAQMSTPPGVWAIPDVGTEVMLASDLGEFEGNLYVIGTYGFTDFTNAERPTTGTQTINLVVTGDINLIVPSGSKVRAATSITSGEALALHSELHSIWQYLDRQFNPLSGHNHGFSSGSPPVSAVGATLAEPSGTDTLLGE